VSEWKAIANEMPPENEAVLCFGGGCYAVMSWLWMNYRGAKQIGWHMEHVSGHDWEQDIETPTHWMPLPPPPQPFPVTGEQQ
jgi:hypothetical protein